MAVLPEEDGHALKDLGDLLFLLSLANQHTPSRQVIGNRLVFALLGQERGRYQGNVIKPGFPKPPGWFADLIGK